MLCRSIRNVDIIIFMIILLFKSSYIKKWLGEGKNVKIYTTTMMRPPLMPPLVRVWVHFFPVPRLVLYTAKKSHDDDEEGRENVV